MFTFIRNITIWQIIKRLLLAGFLAVVLWLVNTVWYKPFNINHFYDRLILMYAFQDPESLTKLGILERYGIKFYNDKLSFLASQEQQAQEISKVLEMLNTYKKSGQSVDQRLSTAILGRYLEDLLLETSFSDHDYLLTPFEGIHLDFPTFMISYHHIHTIKDAEDYLTRLGDFDKKMDKWLEVLEKQKESGLLPPQYMIEDIVVQIDTFLVEDTKQNPIFQDFSHKIDHVAIMPEPVKREMNFQANMLLQDVVYPSYRKLSEFLKNSIESLREGDGVWRMDNGEGYYLALLRKYGSNEELLGDDLYLKAQTEVDSTKQKINNFLKIVYAGQKTQPTLQEYYKQFWNNPHYRFNSDKAGRAKCLQLVDSLVKNSKKSFKKIIWTKEVEPLEIVPFTELQAVDWEPIEYREGTLHTKVAPLWKLNFQQMEKWHKAFMPTVVAGELARHYQRSIQRSKVESPIFRRLIDFEAFREGWQAYVIDVLAEQGYFSSPETRLGKLYWEYTKKMLLVIDVGIHHKKWTRAQAIDALMQETGMTLSLAVSEVDRIVAYPAQAWAYYYGWLGFRNLRKKQTKILAEKFELLNFHETILQKGSMPMDILAKELEKNFQTR